MRVRTILITLAALLLVALSVSAHEGREAGDYELYFGWRSEPAIAGVMNGPEIYVSVHGGAEDAAFPEDIAVDLRAEVRFGDQTTIVTFRPAWGETGHYIAELIPTLPGDYVFHVTGTIGDTAVDETWDSADGGFSTVEPASDIVFPAVGSIDSRVAALEARLADLEARLAELTGASS